MSIQHAAQLRSSPHSAYYSSFFLLRTAVIFNGQPAEIDCSADGELTLSCRYPSVNVSLRTIAGNLGAVLREFGVSTVTHFYCEQAPLFQVCFSSEERLETFLQARETVETELASLLSAMLSEQLRQTNPAILEDVPTVAVADVFLIRPHVVQKEAQVIKVTVENCSKCMALWKESEMFDFGSLFRVYRMDPSKLPGQGAVTLKTLVTELHDVVSWFSLGILLDIPEPELMKIRADHREKTDACKSAMFSQWLRNGPAEPTWSAVARALLGIRMRSLARKVALKYGVALPTSVEAVPLPFSMKQNWRPHLANLLTTFQQLSEEVDKNEQKLIRVTQNLSQAQAEKEAASKEQKRCKHTLATAHSRTRRLIEEKRELQSQLEMKRKELQLLQLLPEQQQQKNEDLRAIIAHKNVEVMELQEKLQRVEKEVQSAREEAQFLRQKLHQTTNELIEKSTRVQELERARSELRGDLERERKRVDQLLMQSAAATSKEDLAREIKLQLSHMQLESKTTDVELAQHKKTIAQKEEETQRLSEQVRALEAQLQEVQDQHSQAPSTAELELEEQLQRLTVETSELRVQLAEAEGERREAVRQLEAVVLQKGELLQLIAELETKRIPDPEKCRAVGPGVESAETDKVAHFQVHLAEADGDPCTSVQEVTAELRSLVNGSVTPATVVCKTPDTYKASYQPSIRGRHELSVVVNGTPIQDSPFQVYVRHPPHLLGKPVRTIRRLSYPWRVATTSEGGIVVNEHGMDGRVSFLSKNGQRLRTIDSVKIGLIGRKHDLDPRGVAVDEDGNIYVTDWETHRLFKFNSEGRMLKSVGGTGENAGQFNNPDGIAIRNNNVYVCDVYDHRIQVFSTNLSVISSFGTGGSDKGQFQYPSDVTFDSAGNLYVADKNNCRVQVFSPSGTFLRQFGSEGKGPGQLSFPYGIHVDHDYVYVVEWGNNRVSIFNTSGGFISSFGKMGSGEGELYFPNGITTDQDGYVYVCDSYNNRIQVF